MTPNLDMSQAPTDRRILGWADGKWQFFAWCDDRYKREPKPFWKLETPAATYRSRKFQPKAWIDLPPFKKDKPPQAAAVENAPHG